MTRMGRRRRCPDSGFGMLDSDLSEVETAGPVSLPNSHKKAELDAFQRDKPYRSLTSVLALCSPCHRRRSPCLARSAGLAV